MGYFIKDERPVPVMVNLIDIIKFKLKVTYGSVLELTRQQEIISECKLKLCTWLPPSLSFQLKT